MALLDERTLRSRAERRAKFRLQHVGTKLNQTEHRAFEELLAKRNLCQSELIRDLILAEIERDRRGDVRPSCELTDIVACRLLLVNVLRPLAAGKLMDEATFDRLLEEVKKHKRRVAKERLHEYLAGN